MKKLDPDQWPLDDQIAGTDKTISKLEKQLHDIAKTVRNQK